MKKFTFSHKPLLSLRERQEKNSAALLEGEKEKLERLAEEEARLHLLFTKAMEEINQALLKQDRGELLRLDGMLQRVAEELKAVRNEIDLQKENLIQSKSGVAEAMTKRKIVEKIREKQYFRWKERFQKVEENFRE